MGKEGLEKEGQSWIISASHYFCLDNWNDEMVSFVYSHEKIKNIFRGFYQFLIFTSASERVYFSAPDFDPI